MNVLTINLSPRKKGTSAMLLGLCSDYLRNCENQVVHIDLYNHISFDL